MKWFKLLSLVIIQILFLSSCLTTGQTNLLREPERGIPSYSTADRIGEYKIKPGDELRVMISVPKEYAQTETLFSLFSASYVSGYGDTKLRTLTVSPQGIIHFPFLGDIRVVGKTTLEVQTKLEDRINKEIITGEGSIVQVSLDNRYFSVIGESKVGRYPIAKEQLTIFQALAQSGDINPYGDRAKVKVIRQLENGTEVRTFDLRSEDIVNSKYYYIQPNDVIYIKPLGRQFWGINSFGSIFAILSTVASLSVAVYNLTQKGK